MNPHPIFVHFPIALLMLWSGIEFFRRLPWGEKYDWKVTQTLLIITGSLGAFAARQTGEIAEELYGSTKTVEMHSLFANITIALYALFLIELILPLITQKIPALKKISNIYVKILQTTWLRLILVLVAITALTVTGMLGGVMVYGTEADPLSPYLLQILGLRS